MTTRRRRIKLVIFQGYDGKNYTACATRRSNGMMRLAYRVITFFGEIRDCVAYLDRDQFRDRCSAR